MTKQEILDRFSDIDFVYNDSSKHETLSRMLDDLLKEHDCNCCGTVFDVAYKAGKADAVVHCKDCIHKNGLNHCPHNNDIWVADNWFCADGERKEGR